MNKEEQAQIIIDATHSLYEAKAKIESLERALAEARRDYGLLVELASDMERERDAALALLREARDDVAEIASKQSKRHRIAQYQDLLAQIDRRLAGKDGD